MCNTIGAVKYLYKYVYKGSDKCTFTLELPEKNTLDHTEKGNKYFLIRLCLPGNISKVNLILKKP